jgi:hypothetical protein
MAAASIDKRPNGKYRARWREYPGAPQHSRHFATKRETNDFLVKVQHDLAHGTYLPPDAAKVGFASYVPVYLSRQVWRASTRENAERALRRAEAAWGDRPLVSIRQADVQAYVGGVTIAPSSLSTEMKSVGGLFRMAIVDGLLARNPCAGVRMPRIMSGRIDPLSSAQVRQLEVAAPR